LNSPHLNRIGLAALLAVTALAAAAQDPSLDELIARAKKRDADAEYALGMRAYEGRGVPRDPGQAFRLMERAAKRGQLEAQNALGFFLQHGVGTAADPARAREWYAAAAERGHARAQVNLGWLYQEGLGVARDAGQARAWYDKALAAGYAPARHNLAYLYEQGLGVSRDPTRAAAIGPSNGTPESASAAEAPIIAGMSGSISGSTDITVAMIWISL